jgi:hypothetical protein
MTLSTHPRQRRSGFGSLNVLEWPEPGLQPNGTSLERLENSCAATHPIQPDRAGEDLHEEWEKLTKYRCAKLVASYPRRLKAVITAKGASTKYGVKEGDF